MTKKVAPGKKQNDKDIYGFKSLGIRTQTYSIVEELHKLTGKPKYLIIHEALKFAVAKGRFKEVVGHND